MVKNKFKNIQKGFSLIELVVVVGIFALITSIAMFDQGKLTSSVLLTNLSYEVGLAVREAQAYGVGVRAVQAQNFNGGYGAHFTPNSTTFFLFKDVGGTHSYDPANVLSQYTFQNLRGNQVTMICADKAKTTCYTSGVNVIFTRPRPEPSFYDSAFDQSPNDPAHVIPSSDLYIFVTNPSDQALCRMVDIGAAGQISVSSCS